MLSYNRYWIKRIALTIPLVGSGLLGGFFFLNKYQHESQEILQNDDLLRQKYERAWMLKGSGHRPRTRHFQENGLPKYTNRLFLENSPYLLQHAHNPVNWYPWSEEAFLAAQEMGRPILLSIGYSTCHWCHVMEEESFEDEEVASYINENYIPVKVDREERPDLDSIYMASVKILSGEAGWPLTLWLTPLKRPFFAGTYFPPRDGQRGIGTGFLTLLKRLKKIYQTNPEEVDNVSTQMTMAIANLLSPLSKEVGSLPLQTGILDKAIQFFKDNYDHQFGGLRGAPKFPSALPIRLLLRYYSRTGDKNILSMVTSTLQNMASGGIYDQVGGGFHRYTEDEKWRIPHFEKMLYDNALRVLDYLEAFIVTGDKEFMKVVKETLHFVDREMTSPLGEFYSAIDSESVDASGIKREGLYYTWTLQEIESILGKGAGQLFSRQYGVTEIGNFKGRNILHRSLDRKVPVSKKEELEINDSIISLYRERKKRDTPLRDEKILTSWNALMISAYVRAGFILNDHHLVQKAESAANILLSKMEGRGRLPRVQHKGRSRQDGFLEDYAFLIAALLDLHECTQQRRYLKLAMQLDSFLEENFEDKDQGAFYMSSHDHERILTREKQHQDGPLPSGNSVAILNLLRLGTLTFKGSYINRAEKALTYFSLQLHDDPSSLPGMLLALDFYLDRPKEIFIVAPKGRDREMTPFLRELRRAYLPNGLFVTWNEDDELNTLKGLVPMAEGKSAMEGRVTAYVCEKGKCQMPTHDISVFRKQILGI